MAKLEMLLLSLFLSSVGSAASAQVGSSFDLVCSGQVERQLIGAGGSSGTEHFQFRVSVSLARNVWCEAPCKGPQPIAAVNGAALILRDVAGGIGFSHTFLVDRGTGDLKRFDSEVEFMGDGITRRYRVSNYSGACTPAHYTSIPDPLF